MNPDEQFAESLRAQVTRVAPRIDVDVTRVVPAARRRRAARAGGITLALALALGGGAWVATTLEPTVVVPGGSTTVPVEPSPSPTGPPLTSSEKDRLADEPSHPFLPGEAAFMPPEGWRDATYYHVVTRRTSAEDPTGDPPLGTERWYGDGISFELTQHGPELMALGDKVDFEGGNPVAYTWTDVAELPTEPGPLHAALRDLYPATQRNWAVPDAASRLVSQAPAAPELRAAAWHLLLALPNVEVDLDARDSEDRPGTALTYETPDTTTTVIFDGEQNLPLEREWVKGSIHTRETYLTTEFTDLPDEVADSVIEVPDLAAMTREDVEVACQQKHLTCVIEEAASDTVPEGTVVSSDPVQGALVSWGALVTVVLSTGP
ncbi:PASTA domain-containing protein [Promicromonospora sp. NPDC060204]|uniref:PASTA domain-containing protein n=1 Tax=Promicromonospora sp. NPDC060204 TaxID=3347071 RepID=UPI0036690FDB